MSAFIGGLPEWVICLFVWGFLSFIMYSGFVMGKEVGLDKGFRAGFDLGKGVGRREVTNQP